MEGADQREGIGSRSNMADSFGSEDYSRQVVSDEAKERSESYFQLWITYPGNREDLYLSVGSPGSGL